MKNRSLIVGLTGMVLVMLTACSSEQWRHTSYETLKAAGRQQCLNEAYTDCPRQPEYGEYLQEREQVLQPANSE
jgi:hypothetical protein